MNRLLLIVDPQIDFISGSLPVPDAAAKMDLLADYIKNNNGKYVLKLVTTDWHPYDHCSFKENGGVWPKHCVHDSVGAAVYQALLDALYSTEGDVEVLRKGTNKDTEEYSIFKNSQSSSRIDVLIKKFNIKPMITEEAILQMELVAHNFFVFKDSDTDNVNVIYKRKDGNYVAF